MTITSKREDILEYILGTALADIDGTGDYNLNPALISREYLDLPSLKNHDFPALFVLDDGPVSYAPMTDSKYVSGSSIVDLTNGMIVNIVGAVKINRTESPDKTGEISSEQNKIFSDILIAMHKDLRQGGNCEATVLIGSNHSVQQVESRGYGICVCTFSIKYLFNPRASNPVT
jgi:hypothetical protein